MAQVLTKLATICVTAALLSGCTAVDTVLTTEDLLTPTALEDYSGSQEISLEVIPPDTQRLTLVISEYIESHYDYSEALVSSLVEGLSIPFSIVASSYDIPHVVVAFGEIDAGGSCHFINGSPRSCTKTVEFDAFISVNHGTGPSHETRIHGSGSATDDDFFSAITTFEPLHKSAANRAFGRFLRRATETIREAIENPKYDSNQTAWLPGS